MKRRAEIFGIQNKGSTALPEVKSPLSMKAKTSKQPKQARTSVPLKDLKPKREAVGGRDASGNTVYIAAANGGVWKTTNGG